MILKKKLKFFTEIKHLTMGMILLQAYGKVTETLSDLSFRVCVGRTLSFKKLNPRKMEQNHNHCK